MSVHFGYTEVRSEPCTFIWRIEKFSMHAARKKDITSPVFESKLHQTQWCLTLNFRDTQWTNSRQVYGQTVDMTLVKTKSDGKEQFINFSLFIVDRFHLPHKSKSGEIVFNKDTKLAKLGTINMELMSGFSQLNKLCMLPDDTLTLRCEMVVSEDGAVVTYKSREEYESRIDAYGSSQHWHAEIWKYAFPLLFLLCVLVGVLLVTGFRSTIALLSACLLLSFICFNLRLLSSAVAVLWDLLFLHLERLVSFYFPSKENVD